MALHRDAAAREAPAEDAQPDTVLNHLSPPRGAQATKKQDRYRESLRMMTTPPFHAAAMVTAEEATLELTEHEQAPSLECLF